MALKISTKAKKHGAGTSPNVFAGQLVQPSEKAVEAALGASYVLWKQLISELRKEFKLDGEEWNSSGVKHGWALRLRKKDRNIGYLGPRSGWFLASFALGDKAVAIARNSELPDDVLKMIAETKRYGEGTPVRIEVREAGDLKAVKILASIKIQN
jgi:hypothetical protein